MKVKKRKRNKKIKKKSERKMSTFRKNTAPIERPIDLTKQVDVLALLRKYCCCGCSEDDLVAKELIKVLEWAKEDCEKRERYDKLYENDGVFYIIAGFLDNRYMIEHGTSIRCSWITEDGKILLETLKNIDWGNIKGVAYDGCFYD